MEDFTEEYILYILYQSGLDSKKYNSIIKNPPIVIGSNYKSYCIISKTDVFVPISITEGEIIDYHKKYNYNIRRVLIEKY